MDEWYYKRGEATFGPISEAHLRALFERGRLGSDTLVRPGKNGVWSILDQAVLEMPAVTEAAEPTYAEEPSAPDFQTDEHEYPPPYAATVLPETSPPVVFYVSAAFLAGWLVFAIIVELMRVFAFSSHVLTPKMPPPWFAEGAMRTVECFKNFPVLLAVFGKLVALVLWQCCAFFSLRQLYRDTMMQYGPASGIWWIIPGAHLFMPLFCLRELRHLSRRRREVAQKGLVFGPLLWTLEGIIILGLLMVLLHAWLTMWIKPAGAQFHLIAWLNILIAVQSIASCVVLLVLVADNFQQQIRLFKHWNDDEFWVIK